MARVTDAGKRMLRALYLLAGAVGILFFGALLSIILFGLAERNPPSGNWWGL